MKGVLAVLAIVVAGMGWTGRAAAHHSFAAEFDIKSPVTLKGKLVKLEWTNPHGWLYLDVVDAQGKVTTWQVETGSPNALLRRGMRKSTLPIGIELQVDGYLSKTSATTANAITVKMPDGTDFFVGSSGTGAPEPIKSGADAEGASKP